MIVDVVFPVWNRVEFVRFSLGMLVRHTDWHLVRRLVIIDDGSTDGARPWLRYITRSQIVPCALKYVETDRLGGAPAITNHYVKTLSHGADAFAKIDSDIVMPAGWLEQSLAVLDAHPELELLGLAAGWGPDAGDLGYQPAQHIGGVGVMRLAPFREFGPMRASGVHGFTAFQERHALRAGWISPAIAATQLDLVPLEPWRSHAAEYVRRGWTREWPPYAGESHRFWDDWPAPEEVWS